MEGRRILLTLFISLSTVSAFSSVFKAPGKSSTTFAVGRNKTTILAIKSPSIPNFIFTFSAKGKVIKSDNCYYCYPESVWVPFFMITNKRGNSNYVHPFSIPEDVGPLDEIDLSVESKEEMEWQIFTLPLEKDDSTRTYLGNHVFFDLPEDEEVWLASRTKNGKVISIPLQLNASNQANLYKSNITVKRDWSIIRIYEDKIDLGVLSSPLKGPVLKGRSLGLGITPESPPECQVFSVPIRSMEVISPVVSVAVIAVLVLLPASYFCYRNFLKKKKNEPRPAETPMGSVHRNIRDDDRFRNERDINPNDHPGFRSRSPSYVEPNELRTNIDTCNNTEELGADSHIYENPEEFRTDSLIHSNLVEPKTDNHTYENPEEFRTDSHIYSNTVELKTDNHTHENPEEFRTDSPIYSNSVELKTDNHTYENQEEFRTDSPIYSNTVELKTDNHTYENPEKFRTDSLIF
ncbi:uncharacterized protein [Palaemon carinicauda]|uniref:uncharacterized protein n=1 Tax=Palaemon carinicauda TaxID=392227 RepID=UPI0035B69251